MATIFKKGDKGESIKKIQKALGITSDGDFGTKTEDAVKKFQKEHHLVPDGIVGEKTLQALNIKLETNNADLNIIKSPITHNISKKSRSIKYIVIHYTAGSSSKKGVAQNTRNVFQNSSRGASADFIVDDETIVQVNPDPKNYYCWAVGDGKGRSGITNSNSISIEMCSTLKKGTSVSIPNHSGWSISEKVINNTIALTKYLMKQYDISSANVIRHYDASGKLCPGILGWNEGNIYTIDGNRTNNKNNSDEWFNFKRKLN